MRIVPSLIGLLALATSELVCAQVVSTSNQWWTYMADYDGIPGSTRIDMGIRSSAPVASLPLVVIAGTKYNAVEASGLPGASEIERLNSMSDKLISAVLSLGPSIYVGTFTQKSEQVHYIYVKDLAGVEEAFSRALKHECPTCEVLFRSRSDPDWNAYLKFLYPNQATMDFYRFDPKKTRTHKE